MIKPRNKHHCQICRDSKKKKKKLHPVINKKSLTNISYIESVVNVCARCFYCHFTWVSKTLLAAHKIIAGASKMILNDVSNTLVTYLNATAKKNRYNKLNNKIITM